VTGKRADSPNRHARPLIFGEVLFDSFPDGEEVLGGAPFNVAWHLRGFGLDPLLVSRVGRDAHAGRVEAAMRDWGMDLAALQSDEDHPTGFVVVKLERGQPSFDILPDRAYDYIASAEALRATSGEDIALIYHGTLALRASGSRAALQALCMSLAAPVWMDINLRAGCWDPALVKPLLHRAAWLKLNEGELQEITGSTTADDEIGLQGASRALHDEYGIGTLVLTLGEHGAMILTGDRLYRGSSAPVGDLVDTVGAGDAFSAVALLGHLRDWAPEQTLDRALEFAARICGVRGALLHDRAPYRESLERWEAAARV